MGLDVAAERSCQARSSNKNQCFVRRARICASRNSIMTHNGRLCGFYKVAAAFACFLALGKVAMAGEGKIGPGGETPVGGNG